MKKITSLLLAVLAVFVLVGCGAAKAPSASTGSYEDVVAYMVEQKVISKDAAPVNINETEGYVVDNTEGQLPFSKVATVAEDYDGVWLFYFDQADAEVEAQFSSMDLNDGVIVIMGGANVLQTASHKGNFAIAFAEDYADKDAALKAFEGLAD